VAAAFIDSRYLNIVDMIERGIETLLVTPLRRTLPRSA